MSILFDLVSDYHERFGDPQYRYFKKQIAWSRRGEHIIPIGNGEEISREEFDANVSEYERIRREAFLGRYPKSYWQYRRDLSKDGWREILIKEIEQFELP